MNEYKESWKKKLEIYANINKSIIIDGNINDLYYSTVEYKFIPIIDEVYSSLLHLGFDDVLIWDIQSKKLQSYKQDKDIVNEISSQLIETEELDGDDYDLGEELNTDTFKQKVDTAKDYFSLLLKRLSNENVDKKIAFVVDWSDSLFTMNGALSEDERNALMILEKTIRNTSLTIDNVGNNDIVVLITNSIASIPSKYYQNNQSITSLHIPKPSVSDRRLLLNNLCSEFEFDEIIMSNTQEFEELNNALDNMTVRDIIQIIRLSKITKPNLSMKKIIALYKFGEKGSPWEDLSKGHVDTLIDTLSQTVKGQDHVIEKIDTMVKKAYIGLSGLQHSSKQQTPKGVLFFVGPTGTGKTELAKALARFLFGDEESYIRFDMSEYNHENSDQKLIGAPPGFVGYEEGGQLTNAVRQKPFSVILFDEIEKAHARILDKFLQILEDGRLTDSQGNTSYFTETVIIFTSNIGTKDRDNPNSAGVYDHINEDALTIQNMFKEKVIEHFKFEIGRPELLHRINIENIIPFNFIKDPQILEMIIDSKLNNLKERLKEKFNIIDIQFEDNNVISIITSQHDISSGGRGILNVLNSKIIEPLSEYLYNIDDIEEFNNKILIIKQFADSNEVEFEFRQ